MTNDGAPAPAPLFIDANGRRLFALYHAPADAARGSVLMLPPFAEEMNLSRRMAYLAGRALAGAGYGFLLPDLTGTGESDGDFGDARWEVWCADAEAARGWLAAETGTVPALLGLRAGALLAASLAPADRFVLWQPVSSGQTMLGRFLRIRVAGGLAGDGPKETTESLRGRWAAGDPVEVAGYTVEAALAAAIDGLSLAALAPPAPARVDWIEIGDPGGTPAPASARTVEAWQAAGTRVDVALCPGEAFWSIPESAGAPAMIDATLAALEAG